MHWIKQLKSVTIISMLALSLAACSVEVSTVSPQEIIENVIKEKNDPFSYYAESKTTFSDGTSLSMKEWRDETGKARTEVIDNLGHTSYSVNDGSTIWVYNLESNEVMKLSLDKSDLQSINKTPSDQVKTMLKTIEKTHTIKVIGNETLLNREVIHITATPSKQESNLFGEQELWIDKKTWFVLKNSSKIDNRTTITEYTDFNIKPVLTRDMFIFKIPEDAKIVELGNLNESFVVHDVQEAAKYIEKPFYYIGDQNDISLQDITVFSIEDISAQLTFNYIKNNKPYFSLVVTSVEESNKVYNGKDGLDVRGQEAIISGNDGFRSISWVEDGIGYAVLIDSADVTTEEIVALINAIK